MLILLPEVEEIPETVNISVNVSDGANPVNGADVSIGLISSTTGSQGGCTLNNIPVGSQTIHVVADGFEEYSETIIVSSEDTSFQIILTEA